MGVKGEEKIGGPTKQIIKVGVSILMPPTLFWISFAATNSPVLEKILLGLCGLGLWGILSVTFYHGFLNNWWPKK